jgi:leucyl/phenylalanyl-tRNA--protein transferase
MFFGESMFTRARDASKCAYAALVAMLRHLGFSMVDCQQSTGHLASLGAREIARTEFLGRLRLLCRLPGPDWREVTIDWPV